MEYHWTESQRHLILLNYLPLLFIFSEPVSYLKRNGMKMPITLMGFFCCYFLNLKQEKSLGYAWHIMQIQFMLNLISVKTSSCQIQFRCIR